jgi:hypothetical protein
VGLLVIGLALALTESGPAYLRDMMPGTGIALAAISFLHYRRRRFLPALATPARGATHHPAPWSSPTSARLLAAAGPAAGLMAPIVFDPGSAVIGRALACFTGLLAATFALKLVWDERGSVPFLRMLLGTPEYRRGESGMRTLVVSLDRGRMHRELEASKLLQSGASWELGRALESLHVDEFELVGRTADGTEVHIQPGGANFGSLRRCAEMKKTEKVIEVRVREEITAGDEVLILGRPEKTGDVLKVTYTGPESLVILGARENVRGAARRSLAGHRVGVAGMLGLALAGLLVAFVDPFMAHDVFEGQVTSVTGQTGVQAGDHCTLEVAHDGTRGATSCQARLECGGVRLYGGPFSGYLECSVRDNEWDTSSSAGPELSFTPPNHVESRQTGGVIQLLIER